MSKINHGNWKNKKIEAPENLITRLEKMRVRMAVSRATETLQRRQMRLEKQRVRTAMLRATESNHRRQNRLEKQRIRTALSRASETEEQRQSRLQQNRISVALARATESINHRETRLQQQRLRTRSMKRQGLLKPTIAVPLNKIIEIGFQRLNIFTNTKHNELIESNTIRYVDKCIVDKDSVNIKYEFGEDNRSFSLHSLSLKNE